MQNFIIINDQNNNYISTITSNKRGIIEIADSSNKKLAKSIIASLQNKPIKLKAHDYSIKKKNIIISTHFRKFQKTKDNYLNVLREELLRRGFCAYILTK